MHVPHSYPYPDPDTHYDANADADPGANIDPESDLSGLMRFHAHAASIEHHGDPMRTSLPRMRSDGVLSRIASKPSGPTSRRTEPSKQMTKGRKSIDQVTLSAVTCHGRSLQRERNAHTISHMAGSRNQRRCHLLQMGLP